MSKDITLPIVFFVLTLAVPATALENLAANPSFESGDTLPDGWASANPRNASFLRDSSRAHGGTASALIESQSGDDYPSFKYRIAVMPGEEYSASVFACSEMAQGNGYIVLEFYRGETRLEFAQGSYTGGGDKGWVSLQVSGSVPEGADGLALALVVHGEGRTWFDDAELIRTAEAPAAFTGDNVAVHIRPDHIITSNFLGCGAQGDFFLTLPSNAKFGVGPEDIELVKDRVRAMRPAVLRLFFSYAWWEPEEGRQTPDSAEVRDMVGWMGFLKEIHCTVLLCPWGDHFAYSPWMNANGGRLPAPDKREDMVRSLADFVAFCRNQEGLDNLRYLSLMNEPDNDWQRMPDPDAYVALHHRLDALLRERGLRGQVMLLGIDGSSSGRTIAGDWFHKIVESGTEYMDGLSCHTYAYKNTAGLPAWIASRRELVRDGKALPFCITEFNTWGDTFKNPDNDRYDHALFLADFAATALNQGAAMLLQWCLFDTYYGPFRQEYGLWRYKTENWSPRPGFYSWSLITRYVRPGSRVVAVETDPAAPRLRAAAVISPEDKCTLLLINRYDRPLQIRLDTGTKTPRDLRVHACTESSIANAGGELLPSTQTLHDVPGTTLSLELPAQSFLLLTDLP